MSFYLLIYTCHILLLCTAFGDDNINATNKQQDANKTLPTTVKPSVVKLTLASEGGSLLPNQPDLTLSKENLTSLMDLDVELGKNKQKSYVKPRKGVDNIMPLENNITQSASLEQTSSELKVEKISEQSVTKTIAPVTNNTKPNVNNTKELKNKTIQEVHKKPLILTYEALANADKNIKGPVNPTSKSLDNNQIPSPNENSFVKLLPSKVNSHPGMIMPIVITILVVPMFAIVGYMALKRGQEAWKNRHYKRMDFLLDGMYND